MEGREPNSPPPAASRYQNTQADQIWWKKSESRDSQNARTGIEPTVEKRAAVKPDALDPVYPIPSPAHQFGSANPPKYDPADHQHWKQIRAQWDAASAKMKSGNSPPSGPANTSAQSPKAVSTASPSAVSTQAPPSMGVHWIRPASDMKPVSPLNVTKPDGTAAAVAAAPTTISPKSSKPTAVTTQLPPLFLSPKMRPASDLPKSTTELEVEATHANASTASSLSPLQKLRNFVRTGSSARAPNSPQLTHTPTPHQQHATVTPASGATSSMASGGAKSAAPVMDIGSPLPPTRRASFGASTNSPTHSTSIAPAVNAANAKSAGTSPKNATGGAAAMSTSPRLQPLQSGSQPAAKPPGLLDRVKNVLRRVSFSGTPASDRASDK